MHSPTYPRIAVVADAHFHDLYGNFGLSNNDTASPTMAPRRLAETARSTRVFNESHAALHYTLKDIVARDIKHVVLLGDYSDDGQHATLIGLRRVLDDYSAKYGLRFHAMVGNHDIFGSEGRHRTKRFLNPTGGYDIATSDPDLNDADAGRVACTDAMYCHGYPKALQMLPDVNFFGGSENLHWETPFGTSKKPEDRTFEISNGEDNRRWRLMDASYLVEPSPGLWLLMIDANVFRPYRQAERVHHAEDFADSTAAGWNAMLVHKPFIFSWMKDVATRAKRLNKRLLTFSHYPVLDPIDGTREDELALLGQTTMTERIPDIGVARAILKTDIRIHFSGHVHINDTARFRRAGEFVVNIGVSSLVAFPASYKIISFADDRLNIETVEIGSMPLNPAIGSLYQKEADLTGLKATRMLGCPDYGTFLFEHAGHLVSRRYLRREWPGELASVVKVLTLADLAALTFIGRSLYAEDVLANPTILRTAHLNDRVSNFELSAGLGQGSLSGFSVLSFLEDWYRLRFGSDLALDEIPAPHLSAYNALAGRYAEIAPDDAAGVAGRFALLFRMFTKHRDGLPSRNFCVDLQTGDIRKI